MTVSPEGAEVYRLPAMTGEQVEQLLAAQKICRMAFNDDPHPYIIALDYIYMDGRLYFHFADYGRKMYLIDNHPDVSVEIDNFMEGANHFDTITLMGRLQKITDKAEKDRCIKALIDSVKARGGEKNVAARHGLGALDPEAFSPTFYRLDVQDYVALRSPG